MFKYFKQRCVGKVYCNLFNVEHFCQLVYLSPSSILFFFVVGIKTSKKANLKVYTLSCTYFPQFEILQMKTTNDRASYYMDDIIVQSLA